MDNVQDSATDFKDGTKDDSNEDMYRPKKKPAKNEKSGKRSLKKVKPNQGTSMLDVDGSGFEMESRSRVKAKQQELVGTRKITDFLSFSTTYASKLKSSIPVDERKERLTQLEHKQASTEKDLSSLNKQVSTLETKARQDQQAFTKVKERTQKALASVLLNLYEGKRQEKRRLREDLAVMFKTINGALSFSDGYLLVNLRDKIEKLKTLIKNLEAQPSKRRSKGSKVDEREESEVRIKVLQEQLSDLQEELKKLERLRNEYMQQYKLLANQQESELYKQKWPIIGKRYLPLELLGKGGFSQVYRGFDLEENIEVAIKLSFAQPHSTQQAIAEYMKHIQRQCKIQRTLTHQNINRLIEVFQLKENTVACIVELCQGTDLSVYLRRKQCLEEREARQIIKQIISALYYLSMLPAQVIHYDLKPQNIMINEGHIKIIDFGLCKLNDTNESKIELTSQGTGTYWYLPPETFDFEHPAKISNKVDIWSTGVIFYELLYGKRPYGHGQTQNAIITKCLIKNATEVNFDEPPPKPYTVSEEAKEFIRECLQYDQQLRLSVNDAYNHSYFKKSMRP